MPASSLGSLDSWGVYVFASMALILLLTPQLAGVVQLSRKGADLRDLDGARAVIDSLRPGVTVVFAFGEAHLSDALALSGNSVSCYDGNGTISVPVRWALPNLTLAPSVRYRLSLVQGAVAVSQVV